MPRRSTSDELDATSIIQKDEIDEPNHGQKAQLDDSPDVRHPTPDELDAICTVDPPSHNGAHQVTNTEGHPTRTPLYL